MLTLSEEFTWAAQMSTNEVEALDVAYVLTASPRSSVAAHALLQVGYVDVPFEADLQRTYQGPDGFVRHTTYRVSGRYAIDC
jgi:hypothetical protein